MGSREIDIPPSFGRFARGFLPSVHEEHGGIAQAIPFVVSLCMPEDREELWQFLTMMLEDNYSDKALEMVWDVCEPSWLIGLGGHRVLYGMALEALEKKIAERREG